MSVYDDRMYMAHKLAQGSTRNGRDSQAKRLGVKRGDGSQVGPGDIIVRQRGTKIHAGTGVRVGKDHTLYAIAEGAVSFMKKRLPDFTGTLKLRTIVSVK